MFIIVSGNIGAGKTTLCKLFYERFGWRIEEENVSSLLYVGDFYSDMKSWSLHNQLDFMIYKFNQQKNIANLSRECIVFQDRSAYECHEIFTQKLFSDSLISNRDFRCLTNLYDLLSGSMPTPDLVIYLDTPFGMLIERITMRGREIEKNISQEYLMGLDSLYNQWINKVTFCPIVKIDTSTSEKFETSLGECINVIYQLMSNCQTSK